MDFKVYSLYRGEDKKAEKVLIDANIQYVHFTLPVGERLPEHNANSNVYMTVMRGKLSLRLDGGEYAEYGAGTLLTIPVGTRMNIENRNAETLELAVVKAPAPIQ
jgi:quercetin dioxygenase-like cupin family protein